MDFSIPTNNTQVENLSLPIPDIKKVCELLRSHEESVCECLVDYVSSLCGVDKQEMMTDKHKLTPIHARWLFWYAYRYMTDEPYVCISEVTKQYGAYFSEQSISNSVNKMSTLIMNSKLWTKRWGIIKCIIKNTNTKNDLISDTRKDVYIRFPRELKEKIKINIEFY